MKLKMSQQDNGLEELCSENGTQLQASKQETISLKELKSTLARCVEILKDYPIRNVTPLRQIFTHFTNRSGLVLRYDYINIVNSWQDERMILTRLQSSKQKVDAYLNSWQQQIIN